MKIMNQIKRYAAVPAVLGVSLVPAFPALAASADATIVTSEDWAPIISAMTAQISVSTVVAMLAKAVGAGIGLVFMWWGARKATRMLFKAFRSGRTSV